MTVAIKISSSSTTRWDLVRFLGAPEKRKSSFSHHVFHFLFRVCERWPKFAFQLASELAVPLGSAANGCSRSVWMGYPKNVPAVRNCVQIAVRKRGSEPSNKKRFEQLVGATDVIGRHAKAPKGRLQMRSGTTRSAPKIL